MQLDMWEADMYWRAMEVVSAQELLRDITAASYPHYKKKDQDKVFRTLHKKAYPKTWNSDFVDMRNKTPEEMAKALAGVLSGK